VLNVTAKYYRLHHDSLPVIQKAVQGHLSLKGIERAWQRNLTSNPNRGNSGGARFLP
jgi:hypothetical protein